jgi:hypothetical protein
MDALWIIQSSCSIFWYKIDKKSTRKLPNIFDDFTEVSKYSNVDKSGQEEYLTINSVKLQPILTKRQFFGHYWTIQISSAVCPGELLQFDN